MHFLIFKLRGVFFMSLISIQNLTFGYDGTAYNVFESLNLQLDTNWRCGLTGRNDRGKTTLLRLLAGEFAYGGNIMASVKFDYFPYTPTRPDDSTIEVLESVCGKVQQWSIERELSLLGLGSEFDKPFNLLSEGQKTRALLAAMFLKKGAFPLIDEPTNHLDIEGRQMLVKYLKQKSGFLLISHDRAFIDECIDHIISINRTDVEVRAGSFSSWYKDRIEKDEAEKLKDAKLKREAAVFEESARQAGAWADKVEKSKKRGTKFRPESGPWICRRKVGENDETGKIS